MHTAVYNLWLEQSSWFSIFTNKKYFKNLYFGDRLSRFAILSFNCNEHMGEENDLFAINIFPQGCKLSCNLMIFHFVVVVSFDFIIAMM